MADRAGQAALRRAEAAAATTARTDFMPNPLSGAPNCGKLGSPCGSHSSASTEEAVVTHQVDGAVPPPVQTVNGSDFWDPIHPDNAAVAPVRSCEAAVVAREQGSTNSPPGRGTAGDAVGAAEQGPVEPAVAVAAPGGLAHAAVPTPGLPTAAPILDDSCNPVAADGSTSVRVRVRNPQHPSGRADVVERQAPPSAPPEGPGTGTADSPDRELVAAARQRLGTLVTELRGSGCSDKELAVGESVRSLLGGCTWGGTGLFRLSG